MHGAIVPAKSRHIWRASTCETRSESLLCSRSGDRGPPRNQEKCRKLKGESFWEFKAGQQRIFWCYDPVGTRRIILLHGFTKKTKKTPSQALDAGREAYREVITEAQQRMEGKGDR